MLLVTRYSNIHVQRARSQARNARGDFVPDRRLNDNNIMDKVD